MKKFLAIAFIILAVSWYLYSNLESGHATTGWLTDMELAREQAKDQDKLIFAYFTGSDWCGYCKKLNKSVLSRVEFKDFAEKNLVLLELDYPRRSQQAPELKLTNRKLRDKFGIRGYPTIVILDKWGNEVARTGYRPVNAETYVAHLQRITKQL